MPSVNEKVQVEVMWLLNEDATEILKHWMTGKLHDIISLFYVQSKIISESFQRTE